MKHIVTIWGANFSSEDELGEFVEPVYNIDGDALPEQGIGKFRKASYNLFTVR